MWGRSTSRRGTSKKNSPQPVNAADDAELPTMRNHTDHKKQTGFWPVCLVPASCCLLHETVFSCKAKPEQANSQQKQGAWFWNGRCRRCIRIPCTSTSCTNVLNMQRDRRGRDQQRSWLCGKECRCPAYVFSAHQPVAGTATKAVAKVELDATNVRAAGFSHASNPVSRSNEGSRDWVIARRSVENRFANE